VLQPTGATCVRLLASIRYLTVKYADLNGESPLQLNTGVRLRTHYYKSSSSVAPILRVLASTLTLLGPLGACRPKPSAEFAGTPNIVGDSALRFSSGTEVATRFRSIEYLGQIPDPAGGPPFLLIRGVECADCDAPMSVLLFSPRQPPPKPARDLLGWYAHPGTLTALEDSTMLRETAFYWGECIADREPGVVQFATEFEAGRKVREVVRIAEIRDGRLVAEERPAGAVDPAAVEREVGAGRCRAVPPQAQYEF
jgi:hypothetical protein